MSAPSAGAFTLLTTLRYPAQLDAVEDAKKHIWLLPYHLQRLHAAARAHGWDAAAHASLDRLLSACASAAATSKPSHGDAAAFRISVRLAQDGSFGATAMSLPYTPSWDPTRAAQFNPDTSMIPNETGIVTVYLDAQPTQLSLFTTTKTTHREHYNAARSRLELQIGQSLSATEDVLIFNPANEIMETSICNIAFWRSGRWVTPSASTGCLPGIARRYLLEQALITELADGKALKTTDVINGEWLLLFNGARGAQLGKLDLRPTK